MTLGLRSGVYLEGFVDETHLVWRTAIDRFPFRIGRRADADLVVRSPRVSHLHAELHRDADGLWLVDLGSTNGSFVNGARVEGPRHVEHDDVIHFADQEFRVVELDFAVAAKTSDGTLTKTISSSGQPSHFFDDARRFRDMLARRDVYAQFQPIVRVADAEIIGYELLGRGLIDGVETLAGKLFEIAEPLDLAVELSTVMRQRGLEQAELLPPGLALFVNTHPAELSDPVVFLRTLHGLRERFPGRGLVLEIHERAVADLAAFGRLRREMANLGIDIAFDDFGTGQARLLELIDVEPACVKFDRAWISGIDTASPRRRTMVERLLTILADMEVAAAAEGVETAAEAAVCRELNFQYAQGYYYGRPQTTPS